MGVAVGQTYLAKAADPRVRVDADADGRAVLVVQAFAKIVYVNTCDLHICTSEFYFAVFSTQ